MIKAPSVISKIIVVIYSFLIFYFQIFTDVSIFPNKIITFLVLCFSIIFVFILEKSTKKQLLNSIKCNEKMENKRKLEKHFLITFSICELSMLIYWFAYMGEPKNPDTMSQIVQATSGEYSDWHPFLHTILFFTLPIKLFGTSTVNVPIQITMLSCAIAYLSLTLKKNNCPRIVIAVWLFITVASPMVGDIMVVPSKDSAMAIFAVVLTGQYINIVLSKGFWIKKPLNAVSFILLLVLTTMMRHNAILFCFPLILSVFVFAFQERKRVIIFGAVYLIAVLFVKFPLAHIFDVSKPEERLSETTGLCMVMMGNVLKETPYSLDPEVKEFLLSVADEEIWESEYVTGDFNSVKWHSRTNRSAIENLGLQKLLKYSIKTFLAEPRICLEAILKVTSMVWRIDGDISWEIEGTLLESFTDEMAYAIREKIPDQNISSEIIYFCKKMKTISSRIIKQWYDIVDHSMLKSLLYCFGWNSFLLIVVSLLDIVKWNQFSKILLAFPILCYNFGTAVFLTGFDWRFFSYSFLITIPTAFLIMKNTNHFDNAVCSVVVDEVT